VTRWFADRADVILLFFDPDKPGTTGETMACLTKALTGYDHKLFIILNKVDQFNKIHDFARAYGSLCWNLSKVIPRKDLPRIYTTFIPAEIRNDPAALRESLKDMVPQMTQQAAAAASPPSSSFSADASDDDSPSSASSSSASSATSAAASSAASSSSSPDPGAAFGDEAFTIQSALGDLQVARKEVIAEVFKAPERRLDNMVTQLYDSAEH
jgi:hypothetical protein